MKNHIKKQIKKRTDRMRTIRWILLSIVILGIITGVSIGYWSALPIGLIIIGIVWYIIPVKNIHVYPHDIRHEYHETKHRKK